jgi:hypothetical protein
VRNIIFLTVRGNCDRKGYGKSYTNICFVEII